MMAFTVELSMVLVLIPGIFFSFCEMDFIDYLVTYGGIHEYFWQENLNNWWYSWNSVKTIETFRAAGWAFGPRFGPPIQPPLRPLGPADSPKSSVFLFTAYHETIYGFIFSCQKIFVKPPKVTK